MARTINAATAEHTSHSRSRQVEPGEVEGFRGTLDSVKGQTRRETCRSICKLYSKAWLQNKQGSFSGKQEQHRQDKVSQNGSYFSY